MIENQVPILKGRNVKVRILRPTEFTRLHESARRLENKTLLDACLLLGARFVECKRIQENPSWFDGRFIHLPSGAQKKKRSLQLERWIRIGAIGQAILPYFFEAKQLPLIIAWNENLLRWSRRAGLDPTGITSRCLRKTYESWLVFSFPAATTLVYLSQGHTTLTSLQHYVNLPFLEEDKKAMKPWVDGWI